MATVFAALVVFGASLSATARADWAPLPPANQDLSNESGGVDYVSSATAPDGTVTAVWKRGTFPGEIKAVRIDPNGVVGTPITVWSELVGDVDQPRVAVGADGTATIVYKVYDGSFNVGVEAKQLSAGGNLGPALTIASFNSGTNPEVAVAPSGVATVVWEGGFPSEIRSRQILNDGTLNSVQTVGSSINDQEHPQIAIDSSGVSTVVWDGRDDSFDFHVGLRRIAADGTPIGSTQFLDPTASRMPHVAVAPNGTAMVSFYFYDGSDYRAGAVSVDSSGSVGNYELISASGADIDIETVRPAITPSGVSAVIWSYDEAELQLQWFNPDGSLSGSTVIIDTLADNFDYYYPPSVGAGPDGTFTLAWGRDTGSATIAATRIKERQTSPYVPITDVSEPTIDSDNANVSVGPSGDTTVSWRGDNSTVAQYTQYEERGVQVTPASINFGSVSVGSASSSESATVTNTGTTGVDVEAALNGGESSQFKVVDDKCSGFAQLPAGGTCQIALNFSPTVLGSAGSQLRISADVSGSPYDVALSGIATPPPAPTPTPTPTPTPCPKVNVGLVANAGSTGRRHGGDYRKGVRLTATASSAAEVNVSGYATYRVRQNGRTRTVKVNLASVDGLYISSKRRFAMFPAGKSGRDVRLGQEVELRLQMQAKSLANSACAQQSSVSLRRNYRFTKIVVTR